MRDGGGEIQKERVRDGGGEIQKEREGRNKVGVKER